MAAAGYRKSDTQIRQFLYIFSQALPNRDLRMRLSPATERRQCRDFFLQLHISRKAVFIEAGLVPESRFQAHRALIRFLLCYPVPLPAMLLPGKHFHIKKRDGLPDQGPGGGGINRHRAQCRFPVPRPDSIRGKRKPSFRGE